MQGAAIGDRGAGGGTAGGEQRVVVADNGDCTAARPRGSQAAAAKRAAVHAAGPCTVTFAGGALLHVRVLGASIRDSPSGVACSDLPLVLYTGAGASVARPVGYTVTAWGGDLLQDLCGGARREPGARCALLGGAAHQEDTLCLCPCRDFRNFV